MRYVPYEDSYVHWVSEGIVRFLGDLGYSVFHDTVGQRQEVDIPLDRVYGATKPGSDIVVFALQFKRPAATSRLTWRLGGRGKVRQYNLMRSRKYRDWIWYCFPYFLQPAYHHQALHLTHFCRATQFCEKARTVTAMPAGLVASHPSCRGAASCRLPDAWPEATAPATHVEEDAQLRQAWHQVHGDGLAECPYALTSPLQWGAFFTELMRGGAGHPVCSPESGWDAIQRAIHEVLGDQYVTGLVAREGRVAGIVTSDMGSSSVDEDASLPGGLGIPVHGWPV